MPQDRRLAAIMFTDIVGYTALMGSDEDKAFKVLRKNREIQRPLIKKYRGEWLKEMGDGILASFHTASDAVRCAGEIQKTADKEGIALRIGIHTGEVVFEGHDVLGDGVNVASRLEELAEEGAINISGSVYKDIKNKAGIETEFIGEKALKNVEEPVKVYKVHFEELKKQAAISEHPARTKNKILYYISAGLVVMILGFLIWLFLPTQEQETTPIEEVIETIEIDKSIAVLPFKSLSEDPEKQYLADGVMDAITGHLTKISHLRVIPRTSVEQYRGALKTASVIGKELNVSYLIEGSFQMYGDKARLTVQLINTKEDTHEWFKEYDRDWKDIFIVQSEVAQDIANEIKIIITPEEKQRIEKIPTKDLKAYGLYHQGTEEYLKYLSKGNNRKSLERAEALYREALKSDSKFALAYTGLGRIYWQKHYWESYFTKEFLDSVLILADKALHYDDELSEAYALKGDYYMAAGFTEEAIEEYDNATRINPNDWLAYQQKGWLHYRNDFVKSIENFQNAAMINRGAALPGLYRQIASLYLSAGFMEKAKYYFREALTLDEDSARYLYGLFLNEMLSGNYEKAITLGERITAKDTTVTNTLLELGKCYMFLGQYERSLEYFIKYVERLEELGEIDLGNMIEIGYVYWQNGYREEAEYYFQEQINYCNDAIEFGRPYADPLLLAYYDLAAVYAFKGEKDKAYKNLRIFNQRRVEHLWMVRAIKDEPFFDSMRDEPEFQQIVLDVEAKYQAERERLKVWMEAEGII